MNRRIVLASRPQGQPTPNCFRLESVPVPELKEGQVLLRTLYLSLDPYMRGRMSEEPSYVEPVAIGEVMGGGTVCRVELSRAPKFSVGDTVLANSGWQDYAAIGTGDLIRIDPSAAPISWSLGILGMTGLTAYVGLLDIGLPKAGETVAVAAATGAVGAAVGQIAKIKGCRAVGIAGGPEKCELAVKELGFDVCIDHYRDDMAQQLAKACLRGIDVYFENVGGPVFDACLRSLAWCGRVVVVGFASGAPSTLRSNYLLIKNIAATGLHWSDYRDRRPEMVRSAQQHIFTLWQQKRLSSPVTRAMRLEDAAAALRHVANRGMLGKIVLLTRHYAGSLTPTAADAP